ncbi:hypothetical protein WHR41_09006 [Cladosporium halotolerans]|uniref:DUF155 domain-containing protein n=1 Tax=Cladosporium halotolerans TaxID=1052096 RepID=A0AB34KEI4_9PEZI
MSHRAATWIAFGSICRRSLTTLTAARSSARHQPANHLRPGHQSLASQAARSRKLPRNHFTSYKPLRQDAHEPPKKESKRKSARSQAASTSLRRVAVEAQRSRDGLVKGKGKKRHVDPVAETREVTAYCAAETYNISAARRLLVQEGFQPDPLKTDLFPQVLHVQTPNFIAKDEETGEKREQGIGDVFVFPSGSVVTWNVQEHIGRNIVTRIIRQAAENPHQVEVEDFEYLEDGTRDSSVIVGDTIVLGTKPSEDHHHYHHHAESAAATSDPDTPPHHETDAILAKIAYSSALARSTKLAVLENALAHYFQTTRQIPTTLSAGSPLRFTRQFILRKTGELLSIRAQLNLYSELTDSLPDLFWDSPHNLGLESYYESLGKALDVGVRIKVLNEKMDYASEIAAVLRERLSEKHSTGLEWLIIGLISIEVVFGIFELWRERNLGIEAERTRTLLEQYLTMQLAKEGEKKAKA